MNNWQNSTFHKKNGHKKYPTPKPYGLGNNMQSFPNILILLGALNVRFQLKHKNTVDIHSKF